MFQSRKCNHFVIKTMKQANMATNRRLHFVFKNGLNVIANMLIKGMFGLSNIETITLANC